ncbi:MAG: NADH:flavin oxidoreductase [Candidatus Bathyarchaeia archaeon]
MNRLTSPITVKGTKLMNRIVMPPMYTGLADVDGGVTDNLLKHYAERAEGLGLMIVEHSYVTPGGKMGNRQLGIYSEQLLDGLRSLAEEIHSQGTPAVIQLNHGGAKSDRSVIGKQPVAPSEIQDARRMNRREMEAVALNFVDAAERAYEAGFDGVEIHGAHGFLLNQFYSPLTNRRKDEYGGSLEDRIRFPLEIVESVREVSADGLLLYRLGSTDMDPEGTSIEDSRIFAERLEESGVDIIDVSGGLCGSRPDELQGKQGYFIPQTESIKEVVEVPVIGVGGIRDPEFADAVILGGRVDLVAVGRALLEDKSWARKAVRVL